MDKSAFEYQVKDVYPSRSWTFTEKPAQGERIAMWEFAPGKSMEVIWNSEMPSNLKWSVTAAGQVGTGMTLLEAANKIHERFKEYSRWTHVIQPRPVRT